MSEIRGLQSRPTFRTGGTCKELRETGLVQWSDLTLTVNTDCSPLFKSTNASNWPIQLSINELSQPHRNANTFLAGWWFGRKHPDMALFMGKFVTAVQEIGEIVWQHGVIGLVSKAYLACVCGLRQLLWPLPEQLLETRLNSMASSVVHGA
ncbi:hypothetical protein MTO96_026739 [Rhipicephalus appendiculatus]